MEDEPPQIPPEPYDPADVSRPVPGFHVAGDSPGRRAYHVLLTAQLNFSGAFDAKVQRPARLYFAAFIKCLFSGAGWHLPDWVHDAVGTMPILQFVAGLLVATGLSITAVNGNLWVLPVAVLTALLVVAACTLHWRATYLRDIKRHKPKATCATAWAVLAFFIYVAGVFVLIVAHVTAHTNTVPETVVPASSSPLVAMRFNVKMARGTSTDVRGHIIFTIPIVNTTQSNLSVFIYSAVQIEPFIPIARDSSEVANGANAVKALVRKFQAKHNSEPITVVPGSTAPGGQNVTYLVIGRYVTNDEWKLIKSGDRYVYFYSMLAINDDPATSIRICGIGDGITNPPIGCPDGLESW